MNVLMLGFENGKQKLYCEDELSVSFLASELFLVCKSNLIDPNTIACFSEKFCCCVLEFIMPKQTTNTAHGRFDGHNLMKWLPSISGTEVTTESSFEHILKLGSTKRRDESQFDAPFSLKSPELSVES